MNLIKNYVQYFVGEPRKKNYGILFLIFDLVLLTVVICCIFYHLILLLSFILDKFDNFYSLNNLGSFMNTNANPTTSSATNTTIIHNNDGWSQGIKSIFIYGTGALRLSLLRAGGTPFQRGFVIGSTLIVDSATKAFTNAINDPVYVEKHIKSWQRIWNNNDTAGSVSFNIAKDSETLSKLNDIKNKFIPDDLDSFSEKILNSVIAQFKSILEPVTVNYSNELLANQIYGISVILFILSIAMMILLIAFILNIVIFTYSDKLMNLFQNRYIRWYISFNKKIIGIEICFIGLTLIYSMYYLSYGIHFIATHPIIFN